MRAEALTVELEKRLEQQRPALAVVKKSLVEPMSTVAEEQLDYLWFNRIPRAKPTLFVGDPGVGKSYAACAIAAAVSNGISLPGDREPEAPLRSLVIAAEDNPADTIKPRLRKLGADMEMIFIPNRELTPSAINANLLDRMLNECPAALVVIDPIIAFANQRNLDRASDVRGLLGPLAVVADKHRAALLLILHMTKNTQTKALYRGQGSVDFVAASRSVFVFAQDAANPERRLMAHAKSSLAGLQSTIEYFIDKDGGFRWGEQTTETADEALGTGEPRKEREAQSLEAARRFLEEQLSNGPAPSNRLKAKAAEVGVSWRTVWRAKEQLEIKASKERGTGEWFWRLA